MDSARAFVRAEVAPHLQAWEDAGSVPRELHARRRGSGSSASACPRSSAAAAARSSTRSR